MGHYLLFNRECAQALEAYTKAFGAEVTEVSRYGDMPPNPDFPVADADRALVLHSRLRIDDEELMCADTVGPRQLGNSQFVSITTIDEALVRQAWQVLADGGEVYQPLAPSFFAAAHGSLRDRYGINWMFTALPANGGPGGA